MAARSALPPVVQESTPALIARILREAIADGRFPPGSQLVEQELARELNVSRGPLREAMQRLTQEGLLVGHRNRGLFVMELTEDAVRDMYLAREAVECAAVRRIVATGTHSELLAREPRYRAILAQETEADEPGELVS